MDTTPSGAISDAELDRIAARLRDAAPEPWTSYVEGRDHDSGSSFIQTPSSDMELSGATVADQDFIAHARQDVARLLDEIRRLRVTDRVEIKEFFTFPAANGRPLTEREGEPGDLPFSPGLPVPDPPRPE